MRIQLLFIILCILFIDTNFTSAQSIQPPAEGKSAVYFVRLTSLGFAVSFEYFHQDKYIGAFKGKSYFRYECNPGENLFWASSENKEFITADLKEGGTYIVIVDVVMGAMKARVGLTPISEKDTELFMRAKELINSEPPATTPQEKIEKMNVKLKDFITEKLKMYEDKWKTEKNFKHITSDMALSDESMK